MCEVWGCEEYVHGERREVCDVSRRDGVEWREVWVSGWDETSRFEVCGSMQDGSDS